MFLCGSDSRMCLIIWQIVLTFFLPSMWIQVYSFKSNLLNSCNVNSGRFLLFRVSREWIWIRMTWCDTTICLKGLILADLSAGLSSSQSPCCMSRWKWVMSSSCTWLRFPVWFHRTSKIPPKNLEQEVEQEFQISVASWTQEEENE